MGEEDLLGAKIQVGDEPAEEDCGGDGSEAVSYTHLDVYKRQI